MPTAKQVEQAASVLPEARELRVMEMTDRAVVVGGLPGEQPRYFLQHALGFQVHDVAHPHWPQRHGRAEIGWEQP